MSEVTVIRSPQDISKAFGKLKELTVKSPTMPASVAQPEPSFAPLAPLTLEQVNAKIDEFSLALDSPLPDPVRAEIEHRRAELVKNQFTLVHGFVPDEEGNRPLDVAAITAAATKSAIESLAAAPESESCGSLTRDDLDIDEQAEALNEIDEADTAVVSEIPAKIPTSLQMPQAVTLGAETVVVLRAALRANLMHTVIKVLSAALQEK